MKRFLLFALVCATGCSPSEYSGVEPTPTLTVEPAQGTCQVGMPLEAQLSVSQRGFDGNFAITVLIRQGSATISIDGTQIDTSGQWIVLETPETKLTIVPQYLGDLTIEIQARGPHGALSKVVPLFVTVSPTTPLTAEALCDAQITNPARNEKIPVQLHIEGEAKEYEVIPTLEQGAGKIYYDGHMVSGGNCSISGDATFYFDPEIIGEHILSFEVSAAGKTAIARAYVDVIKDITVKVPVEDCFTIKGAGAHNVEGEIVTLELVNDELFNFEAAGWYDAEGNLLSEDPTLDLKMSRDCITDIEVKLKKRIVNISRDAIQTLEFPYLIMQNGKPVPQTAYDYRTQCIGDYRVSDPIKFYYEEYKLDKSTVPPLKKKYSAAPLLDKGNSRSTYLWRCDKKFTIYLRVSDNTRYRFNASQRYIESETTRYYISSDIIMQFNL